jgi:hypothetical protein
MKTTIDLREIGHEEMILEEVAHKDDFLKAKFPEAKLVEPLENLFNYDLPTLTKQEKGDMWKRINLIRFMHSLLP